MQAVEEQMSEQEYLRIKYAPNFPHKPTITPLAAALPIEDNKEDFFQRMYDTRVVQDALQTALLRSAEIAASQAVNTVHPRTLTAEQRAEVSRR
jgi:hypothetical protein